jgi:hypothetical protein
MSVCIECAIDRHDFEEMKHRSLSKGTGRRAGVNAAFIDGRQHRLCRVLPYHVSCDDCHRIGTILYVPDGE